MEFYYLDNFVGYGDLKRLVLSAIPEEPAMDPEQRAGFRPSPAAGGTETILVVEDEELVLHNVVRTLRRKGYRVLAAASGPLALALLKAEGTVELILTDVIMPQMNGSELIKQVRALYPAIKALYMSGYPEDLLSKEGVLETGVPLISKPFYSESLCQKIRDVLDQANG